MRRHERGIHASGQPESPDEPDEGPDAKKGGGFGEDKDELQKSGWLRKRMPDVEDGRRFMKSLQEKHAEGARHDHLSPGSPEAQEQLRDWLTETGWTHAS